MVGRWNPRLGGLTKTAPATSGPASFRSAAEPTSRRAVLYYFSAALRAVFRFLRRASAAFKALASLGFT
jgi:hypothetical protein